MQAALKKRDTRVQIVIVENGRYILLKHLAKKENTTFWGLPGGGREPHETDEEAAIREALEETGLDVQLLPIKHEVQITGKTFIYNRIVTFMAFPVAGEAKTGSEPEESLYESYNYSLIGLKWQVLDDDGDLETFTRRSVEPVREMLRMAPLGKKAGCALYRRENGSLRVLLSRRPDENHGFDLPRWDVRPGESPEEVVKREIRDSWGVNISNPSHTGFFFHHDGKDFYRNDIFSFPLAPDDPIPGDEMLLWVDARQAGTMCLSRESRQIIDEMEVPLKQKGTHYAGF
jgi:ADP-ribose pyrophosphatase YjhB (NUDIX family)